MKPLFDLILLICIIGLSNLRGTNSQKTNFVDQNSKLVGFAEPGWFIENIPFVEVPDKQIEDVYYYRWSTLKRHLRYATLGAGYIVTEFVHNSFYAGKFGTINAAAGHHIYEARWLKNLRYVQDYINFWARQGIHTGNDQYSEWIADASYQAFLVNADVEFIKSQQTGLVNIFENWYRSYEPTKNMFFISPHDDAQEQSASSIQTSDPYHGGLGYRPSFNSEMYANARAIAAIARLNGDESTALDFENRASQIRQGVLNTLWDDERTFFYHMQRLDNPNDELLDTREEVGFYPWRWGVPDEDPKYSKAWSHLLDPQGFNSVYGPSTCEQRSQWYDGDQVSQCCWWNGNSWPYSTSITLNSLAALLRNYNSSYDSQTYVDALHKYANTQYKNGVPYVAECHSPNNEHWVCDGFNHSEHYAHSTYTDNVLGDLIGIQASADDIFQIHPLIPSTWAYFIAENIFYHGHSITVLYDEYGSHYNTGVAGQQIYVNGVLVASQPGIGPMSVPIPPPVIPEHDGRANKRENYAANVNLRDFPRPNASFTHPQASSTWHAVDGRIFYDYIPSNRWSNFGSGTDQDWFSIDFGAGRAKGISQVKIYVYSDVVTGEGRTDCPKEMIVEYYNNGQWKLAPFQTATPAICAPNDVNVINFLPVLTEQVRIVFTRDVANDYYVGVTEIEIWAPYPQTWDTFEAEDGYITGASIQRSATALGNSYVTGIEQENSSVEFLGIWVEEGGEYEMTVFYANGGMNTATASITVNNVFTSTVTFQPTGDSWGEFHEDAFVTFTVPFQRGNNNIIFRKGDWSFELDAMRIAKI